MEYNYKSKTFLKQISNKTNKFHLFFLFLALLFSKNSFSQQSYTFTSASGVGKFGPTQTQVTNAYLSTNLSGSVTATAGIQSFTIPTAGVYHVYARGAQGAGANGGNGAIIEGDFPLVVGDVLRIVVGQQGVTQSGEPFACGGGGGSFVLKGTGNLVGNILVIAGGGGGSAATYSISRQASTGTSGNYGAGVDNTDGAGGLNGNGGNKSVSATTLDRGAAGGGFFTDGQSIVQTAGAANGGSSFINGCNGGSTNTTGADGGFGGGGAVWTTGFRGAGGGGGYSGGGGGQTNAVASTQCGGGGGSFNSGTNQTNAVGTATGDGIVIISETCNVKIFASGGTNSISPAICSGNSLTLTTTAVSNYTWSTGNTTNTTIVVSPTVTQTYSIVGTSTAACQAAATITVIVNGALPVLTITNTPNNICLGKTATLTAGGAVSYTWAGGPGGVVNGQSFLPTATANYTVTGQNGCGTTTSVTTITIAPLAVSASSSPTLVCSGSPATLTASSAVTGYTWYPVAIPGSSVIVSPTVNTIYTVVASDGTCSGVATLTLNTKPNPTLSIAASNQTVCEGAIVTMTASGALSYTWGTPASNSPNISDNPTSPTLYVVSGMNSVNCISTANQIIYTTPSPTVSVTSNKTTVCSGDPVTLTASGATTYNWTSGPATSGNVVNPTSNTTYTVTGTTSPCSNTKMITINVLTVSIAASVTTPSICNGASTNLHGSGATTYSWVGYGFPGANASVSPSITTIYTLNATTSSLGLSCPSTTNITVTVFNNPVVTIATTKTVVCKTDAPLVLTGSGATTYTWSTATVSTNINVHPQSTTTYSITGADANGCMNTASKTIQVNVCNGITELTNSDKKISVYPNPSNGEFAVSSDTEINLRLINELGQEIRTIKLSEQNEYKVSVSNLANGVYFIVGQNGTDKISQKIIVNK